MSDSDPVMLVIDDEEVVHASVQRILSRLGYQTESALSAAQGLEMMAQKKYDAVITDLMMPEMDGLGMLAAMKDRGIDIPIIMITGYPTIKTAVKALRLGAMDYIPKPFTRQELLSPLNRALRRDGANGQAAANWGGPGQPPQETEQVPVKPGDVFFLPGHSWAVYNQDGTVDVGVEQSFLAAIPQVEQIETPLENDLLEQGYTGFKLKTEEEVHGVFMPLGGRVVSINDSVLNRPGSLEAGTWVLKILPARLSDELASLSRRPGG
ncbi:MAG: response regulator [Deltaproteobacteria bacterium]|nr:response regulator [Deltaproteobacteria bacterium]